MKLLTTTYECDFIIETQRARVLVMFQCFNGIAATYILLQWLLKYTESIRHATHVLTQFANYIISVIPVLLFLQMQSFP